MRQTRRQTLGVLAGVLAAGVLASCDSPTRPPTEGSIAPRIALIRPAEGTANLVGSLDAVVVTVSGGPTGRVVPLDLQGSVWRGRASGLKAGTYDLIIEGRQGSAIWYYGRVTGIVVARGQTVEPAVQFREIVSTVSAPPLPNTTNYTQRIPFLRIPDATNYLVQWSQDASFASGVTDFVTNDTNPLITVNATGTWHVRTRANVPGDHNANNIPFSASRSWVVTVASGGNDQGDATPVPIVPGDAETVTERNLTATKREDWFEMAVRAGDSLFIETFASRLALPSSLNTILTLFQADGTTQIATNNDFSGTDSRIVVIAPNTETAKIRVSAVGTTSGHYELSLEIRRLPAAPSSLTRTVVSGTRVDLDWTDNSDNETTFRIERCTGADCTVFTEIANVAAGVDEYADESVVPNQVYRWRVRARNTFGNSAYVESVNGSTFGATAPTALTATTVGENRIDLTWNDNADNELGFQIERCTGVSCNTFLLIASPAEDAESYSDLTTVFGQSYSYRIRATNAVANSTYATPATANTFPPATPSALSGTVAGPTQINLAWTDNSNDELGFHIERCTGDACSDFAPLATVGAGVQSHQDMTAVFNTGYRYRVRAFHVVTGVAYTNVANADTRPPTAASAFTATTVTGTRIDLAWSDNSDDETGFLIERCLGAACVDFAVLTTTAPDTEALSDIGVSLGQSYRYRVTALGVPGNSTGNPIADGNTILPDAPTTLLATTVTATRVDLSWANTATNATSVRLERCVGNGCLGFALHATLGATATTHIDTDVVLGSVYRYRVQTVNAAGVSAYTNTAQASTESPADPSALVASTVSGSRIDLTWVNNAPSATDVLIERCNGAACTDFVQVASVPTTGNTYQDFGVAINNSYRYQVRVQNAASPSGYSNVSAANTIEPGAPASLTATTTGANSIQLTWGAATGGDGITAFEIQRCDVAACVNFAALAGVPVATLTYNDNSVTLGNDYRYRVRAVNIVGPGAFSAIADAETRVPTAPTALAATTLSGTSIGLTWTDNATDETGYLITRCNGVGCTPSTDLATIAAGAVAYTDNTAVIDSVYRYRVIAVGVPGNSTPSNIATANTLTPAAPSGSAAVTVSGSRIDVSWTDNSNNEGGFQVQRCAGVACNVFTNLAVLPTGSTTHEDSTVASGQSYTYRVRAANISGFSAYDVEVTANTFAPAAPSDFTVTAIGASQIDLAWTNNAPEAVTMRIERCATQGCADFAEINVVAAAQTTYSDFTVGADNYYTYRIRAQNLADVSPYVGAPEVNTLLPNAPASFAGAAVTSNQIQLTWSAGGGAGVSSYVIERCDGPGCTNFSELVALGTTTFLFDDNTVSALSDYRYRIRATNLFGSGPFSDTLDLNTRGPNGPTGLAATTMTGIVRLTWTDNADNEQQVVIGRCEGVGCAVVSELATVTAVDLVQWDDSTAAANANYSYQINVKNSIGDSPLSNVASTNTNLAVAPTALSATTESATQIDLWWTDNALNETGFAIERCTTDGCSNFTQLAVVAPNTETYQDFSVVAEESYTYRVSAVAAFGNSAPTNESTATTRVPLAPSDLVVTTLSNTSVHLDWTDNSLIETFNQFERCAGVGCVDFAPVGNVDGNTSDAVDIGLTPNETYRYRVRASNAAGASAYSNIAEATTNLPAIPSALSATIITATDLDLNWTDNATDETAYEVEQCVGAGCGGGDFFTIAVLAPDVVTFPVSGLTGGEYYKFRVRAQNGAGYSDYSNITEITAGAPAAPAGLTATTTGAASIDLNWADQSNNEGSFVIERCEGAGCGGMNFAMLTGVPANSTTFTDNAVAPNTTYNYRVLAENAAGISAYSNEDDASTNFPDAPTTLTAVTFSSSQINLSWTDGGPYETGFEIERCQGVGCTDFVEVGSTGADDTDFADAGLTAGEQYRYRVRAENAVGFSNYSNIAEAATDLPAAPTALGVVAISPTRIDLVWTDNADNETDYLVERCTGLGCSGPQFTMVAFLGANVNAYSDETVVADETYTYRVQAVNVAGASGFSNIATTDTYFPQAPTFLSVLAVSQTQINLSWQDNATNELSYEVERCTGNGCVDFAPFISLPANTIYYEDTSVDPDQYYSYRVQAANNLGASSYDGPASAYTLRPYAPQLFTAVTISGDQIDLTWNDVAIDEDGYRLERCVGVGCSDYAVHAILPAGSAAFQDTGLAAEQSYTYRLQAYSLVGFSDHAGPITATTMVPALPSSMAAVAVSSAQMDITWIDNADNEDGFRIERCSGVGCLSFVEIGVVGPNSTYFASVGLTINTVYRYRIRAFNAAGPSAYTAIFLANTFAPGAPSGLTATTLFDDEVAVEWSDNSGNETGFRIERCAGAACVDFVEIAVVGADAEFYSDGTVPSNSVVRYRVRAYNGIGNSPYSNIAEDNTTVPATPTDLEGVPNGQTQINISWTDNATDETAYWIERCTGVGCTDFAEIFSHPANTTTHNDLTVAAATVYRYRVRAEGNGLSDYSNIITVTTILPADPTGLAAVAVSDGRIDLTWTDNADNEVHYYVSRCEGGAGCGSFSVIAELDPNVTSYSDLTVVANTQYAYIVTATNNAGSSNPTNEAVAETNVPGIPTSLTATTVTATQIDLAWTDNAVNEDGFIIERCEGGACTDFADIQTVGADVVVYSDNTLNVSTSYRYRVRAFNANGSSGVSNIAGAATNPPADPTNLVAATMAGDRIDITWDDNADNEAAYLIERCDGTGCSTFAEITDLAPGSTTYSDLNVLVDSIYTYRVRAINAAGVSNFSNEATASTYRPAIPTDLNATTISATRIDLTWTDNANNETGVHVERCTGSSCVDFVEIASLPSDVTSYQDNTVSAALVYTYRVRMSNIAGYSDYSATDEATTDFPLPPSALTATTVSDASIDLAWSDNATNEDGYFVERCTGIGCTDFAALGGVAADVAVFNDNTVSVGNSYTYRVQAHNGAGTSEFSNEATTTTFVPPAPVISSATAFDGSTVLVQWSLTPNTLSYQVERCVDSSCTFTVVANVGDPATENYDGGLVLGETYRYRMRAFNVAGASDYSPEVLVGLLPPADPSSLVAMAASGTQIALTWADNSNDEQGFRIERCDNGGCAFAEIVIVAAGETSYVDAGLTEGDSYIYRVIAYNAIGNSAASNESAVVLKVPEAPVSLVATTTGPGQIDLTWVDESADETSFAIERCAGVGCGSFVQVATVGADVTAYQNTGLTMNVLWRFRVRALNNVGPSDYSNEDQANTILPVAASDLVATPVHGERIDLSWTDNSPNNTGFRVERCVGSVCGDFATVQVVGPNATNFIDNATVAFNNTYTYRVIAFNISGDGAASGIAVASTVLNAPSNLKATAVTRTQLDLSWQDNSGIEVLGQQIERCAGFACSPETLIFTPSENVTFVNDAGLIEGTEYSYRIRAVTIGGYSDWSNIAVGRTPTTLASAVALTGLTDVQNGELQYVMNVPPGALGLRIRMETDGTGDPDLYVKHGQPPLANIVQNDALNCVPIGFGQGFGNGVPEQCTIDNPASGDWFSMIHAWSPHAGSSIKMSLAQRFGWTGPAAGSASNLLDLIVAQKIVLTERVSVTHFGATLQSANPGLMRMGIYSNRFVGEDQPDLLLTQLELAVAGAGLVEAPTSEMTLEPGTYWVTAFTNFSSVFISEGGAPRLWYYFRAYGLGYEAAWPAAGTNVTNYNAFNIWFRGFR